MATYHAAGHFIVVGFGACHRSFSWWQEKYLDVEAFGVGGDLRSLDELLDERSATTQRIAERI
jgi:hypothetical protein